ncbi:FliI/YscN family ATPase [Anaeromyxobacter dehalogenans]|uniref:Flagellum-specific ATP synthase n=1 Tax=Anaeromyxobacter dehalogenans (strain 2CP-C) TaxID=290397 RepID=Q2IQT5_ANADE|nr:FliI/YscN family ATPase [Anaeromyxobacter dehalogenans]ABC81165.1 type III secretion system ATPase, FliI/YscN [Anaeromyxobacter dehalogenans 2CP-C]
MTLLDRDALARALAAADPTPLTGTVVRAAGLLVEALLPQVPVGTACEIHARDGAVVLAEVIGFQGGTARLMPLSGIQGVAEGCVVVPRASADRIPVDEALLGRVVDASLRPVDGGPVPILRQRTALHAAPPPALSRRRVERPVPLGIRAVDACLTVGEGQRVAVMAGPGVGKSVLLGMLARSATADVVVVGLVGERGREVREFVERDLGPGLARAVVVVATSDASPLERLRAAMAATAVAEWFRGRGRRVLLLVDSLSRVAQAQREIGLAAGEPPTTRGYPPSAFAILPRLVERAGNDAGPGSITAFYTVLAEGDDHAGDPIADAARATLDGHLVLSRRLAESGHFPAIDVLASVSRVMNDIVPPEHRALAREAREVLSAHREAADLVEVGAYAAGSNPRVDRALRCIEPLRAFLRQDPAERTPLPEALDRLARLLAPPPAVPAARKEAAHG